MCANVLDSTRITKKPRIKKESAGKRSGNNLYGSKGKVKCQHCRAAHRTCVFESPSSDCSLCIQRGFICGEKTRRGGEQQTVRISVLEQLLKDRPNISLDDAIKHFKGDTHQRLMQPTPETESYTLSRASSVDSTVPDEWSKDMGLATPLFSYIQDPLCMELSTPDRMGHYMLKDERSPTPEAVDPTNPIADAPTPQWPSQLSDYNHFSQFKTEDEVDFQGNIFFDFQQFDAEWGQWPIGPYEDC